jgi:hypothetical protein
MQLLQEQEVALANSILARQMRSIEPGPSGSTQRDYKQHRTTLAPPAAPLDDLDDSSLSSSGDLSVASASSSANSSVLYSGSEAEWEGGFVAAESMLIVSELAEHLLHNLLAEVVQANMAVEDKKYTRRLLSRARERERTKSQQMLLSPHMLAPQSVGGVPGDNSPDVPSPRSPSDQERKKARRQAIKL